jgi:hypothetical protein
VYPGMCGIFPFQFFFFPCSILLCVLYDIFSVMYYHTFIGAHCKKFVKIIILPDSFLYYLFYCLSNSQRTKVFMKSVLRIRDVYPGSQIPDPDFYPSRIPNPGSRIPDPKTVRKERGEKKFFLKHFL